MLAFNTFDPYAVLAGKALPDAKPAKDAKDNKPVADTLASLASLATPTGDYASLPDADYAQECYEERAAIVAESGLPTEWAETFSRMDRCQRPEKISEKTWRHIMNHIGLLLDLHIHDIIKYGWSVADIFGCHYAKPENRYDAMGLLLLLGDAEVIRVEREKIAVRTFTGKEQFYYRMRLIRPQEQVMIWELK